MEKIKKHIKKHKRRIKHSFAARWWRRYQYKHTTMALLFLAIFLLAINTVVVQGLILSLKELGIVGVFITGVFFVSFFTAGPATIVLVSLAGENNALMLAPVAGLGSLLGDWIILKYVEENVAYELRPLAKKYGVVPILRQMKSRRFRPFAVVMGMVFIASPGPDEVGLGLLGLSHIPNHMLMPLLYLLNTGGIYVLVLMASLAVPI